MGNNAIRIKPGEVLEDYSSTGRRRPWVDHKMANELLAIAYDEVDPDKAARLRSCCEFVVFRVNQAGERKLDAANFCRVRLCPLCTWRRSMKAQAQMMQIAQYLTQGQKQYSYIFLTLTMKNVKSDKLSAAIDHLMKSWDRLTHRKRVKDAVHGYYRAMEVTHNVTENTYHPHFHVLMAVDKSYYKHNKYMTQAEWAEYWKRALKADYTPIVDVRQVKGNDGAAIAEIAKYPTKIEQYIIPLDWELTIETVKVLDTVLAQRRFIAYGGVIADAHRRLHLDDTEDGDLVHIEQEKPIDDAEMRIVYYWYSGYRQYRAVECEIVPGKKTRDKR